MKLCVMGLGYIGLPTAVMFATHGIKVHGVDINQQVVDTLNKQELHIEEPGLKELLIKAIKDGNLSFSTQPEPADAFILAVPTPITEEKRANLDYVRHASKMILPYLRKGNLVVLESTVPPKTVEEVLVPILQQTSLKIGEEILVSHSPERIIPGNLLKELVWNDRIIGGINQKSSELTANLYKRFVKGSIHATDATTAEMVKLVENTYRDVNIAYANELARIAEKIGFNVWEAIRLANSHPRVNILRPGPGVGGHCIAVDPWFIVEQAPEEAKLIGTARQINDHTPRRIVEMIENTVQDLKQPVITLLGLAFKENTDDLRESPSLEIMHALHKKGYQLKIYDPLVKQHVGGKIDTLEEAVRNSDCLVLLTGHEEFKNFDFQMLKGLVRTKIVFDTRNIFDKNGLEANGFQYIQIGNPIIREN
ncbi:nucleotide sugar dehydrogenase [Peribacillus sp. SCS-37]|uniref:nucleotide sugar dehydrogenase n=1 Tax=Paraperibacillus esterisolvens TaxID=3115296 RepID=UPI003906167B